MYHFVNSFDSLKFLSTSTYADDHAQHQQTRFLFQIQQQAGKQINWNP